MSVAYFDCFSGAAGDMILGALIDAGLPMALLKRELAKIAIGSYKIVRKKGPDFAGTDLGVVVRSEPSHSDYKGLDAVIARSTLKKETKELARGILERLARAEARVHGRSIDKVHFHEVGAVDSLVDIVGSAIGFEYFKFSAVHCSPLPLSRGSIECAHGTLPVPAPATLELIKGVPLEKTKLTGELVTPTGAAILTAVASHFGENPLQRIERVGIGFGDRRIKDRPNILRLMIGEGFRVVTIEADVDDMNPQLFENAMEKMFAAGAADVSLQPIQMKKNRPGVRVSCMAPWDAKDRVIDSLLTETTTFGVRYWPADRKVLVRNLVQRKVRGRGVSFKIGYDESGRIVKAMPEFEDVKRLARKTKRPVIDIYNDTIVQARELIGRLGRKPS